MTIHLTGTGDKYKEHRHRSYGKALQTQARIKRKLGYKPSIFRLHKDSKFKGFAVVEPIDHDWHW